MRCSKTDLGLRTRCRLALSLRRSELRNKQFHGRRSKRGLVPPTESASNRYCLRRSNDLEVPIDSVLPRA